MRKLPFVLSALVALAFCAVPTLAGDMVYQTQIQMMPPPTQPKHVATKEYVDAADTAASDALASEASARSDADIALGQRVDDEIADRESADTALDARLDGVETTANNSVQYDAEGDVPLQAGTNIQVVIPQPDDPTAGDPVDPIERTLLDTDNAGNFIVGSPDSELNLQASMRPTTQIAGGDIEENAFLSDLTDFVIESDLDEQMAYKADLVGGTIPASQLPEGIIPKLYNVANESDLVTLTQAVVNDEAYVTSEQQVFKLIALPPTTAANWTNVTGEGSVQSVNGLTGAVTLDLANLPNVQNALDDKADAAGVVTLTGAQTISGGKTFSDPVYVPTASITQNNTYAASTRWVNNKVENYLPLSGGTLTGRLTFDYGKAIISFIDSTAALKTLITMSALGNLSLGDSSRTDGSINYYSGTNHAWYSGGSFLGRWTPTDLYVGPTPILESLSNKLDLSGGTMTGNILNNGNFHIGTSIGTNGIAFAPTAASAITMFSNNSRFSWRTPDNAQQMLLSPLDLYVTPVGGTQVAVLGTLALKAPLASPTFTGAPKGPTAAAGTSTTQLATTAFAMGIITEGTADLTAGTSALTTGHVYLVYE